MSIVRVGFAKGIIKGSCQYMRDEHDPLQINIFFIHDEDTTTVIVSLDIIMLSSGFCNELRQCLSIESGIKLEHIIIHCTHTHTSPYELEIRKSGLAKLTARICTVIEEARNCAEPATIAYCDVDIDRKYSINRRHSLPGNIGSFTVYMGYEDNNGQPDAGWLNRIRLAAWQGRAIDDIELQKPMIYDGDVDGLVQGLFFRSLDNKPLGSIVRYCAHPCIGAHTTEKKYSADYPGIVRKIIEKRVGGICCFLTGPCGNIAPWEKGDWAMPVIPKDTFNPNVIPVTHKDPNACWGEVERIGSGVAEALLAKLPADNDYITLSDFKINGCSVAVPLRNDIHEDIAKGEELGKTCRQEFFHIRSKASLRDIKRLADKTSFYEKHHDFYYRNSYITKQQCRERRLDILMPAIQLNNVILQGYPGESFWQVSQPAFEYTRKNGLHFMSYSFANGNIGYMPIEAERPGGDYECNRSVVAAEAPEKIAQAAINTIDKLK